jgi:hypothetical protein
VLKNADFRGSLASATIGTAVASAFCSTLNWAPTGTAVAHEMCAVSWSNLSEQFRQPAEVVGGHREGELSIDLEKPAMPHLAQAGHRLGPAEGLLDAFADALRDRIAGMTGDVAIDRAVHSRKEQWCRFSSKSYRSTRKCLREHATG